MQEEEATATERIDDGPVQFCFRLLAPIFPGVRPVAMKAVSELERMRACPHRHASKKLIERALALQAKNVDAAEAAMPDKPPSGRAAAPASPGLEEKPGDGGGIAPRPATGRKTLRSAREVAQPDRNSGR